LSRKRERLDFQTEIIANKNPLPLGNFNQLRKRSEFTEVPPEAMGKLDMSEKITAQVGDKQIIIETGKLAKQADGAVTVQLGETIVIVAAVAATKAKEGQDFFPLTVDYREKAAAAGKFPGGYFKREGRPTEKEILTCRLTDRPIRPLFPKGWYNEVQVQTVVLSADGENDPDILSIIGASAALMVSDIPWAGPLGAVRVGRINGKFIAYPTHTEQAESDLDLVYVGNDRHRDV
jgi:polyribonucleotide nucleotidyltransferase